jgi:hypothetical protein
MSAICAVCLVRSENARLITETREALENGRTSSRNTWMLPTSSPSLSSGTAREVRTCFSHGLRRRSLRRWIMRVKGHRDRRSETGSTMATVRKRTWKTGGEGEVKTAWVADYFDQDGKRHIKTCRTPA